MTARSQDIPAPDLPPPRYLEFNSYDSRLETYRGWPEQVVGIRPEDLANSGLFYIGSADRVRCFQCGVTLRNWETGDDPLEEHKTWSPECPYILWRAQAWQSQTGFQNIQIRPAEIGEDVSSAAVSSRVLEPLQRNLEQLGINTAVNQSGEVSSINEHPTSSPGQINLPLVAMASQNSNVSNINSSLENPTLSPMELAVMDMGFSHARINVAREDKVRRDGTDFPDATSLLEFLLNEDEQRLIPAASPNCGLGLIAQHLVMNDELTTSSHITGNQVAFSNTPHASSVSQGNTAPNQSNEASGSNPAGTARGREKKRPILQQCKICGQNEVTVTFLPCGHLIACEPCAKRTSVCPRCGKKILGTVKTYLA